ncbi:ABC transporter substrate-binding protein [Psychrobacillus sp.]|uniref:ABC transporter substrate-binding protein n=1 Tax=Psychrobacillus sp. TaxID=1871623 RepID=UPI0028BDD068|nr:ABC transporter substrate-binding protein [Psychrobacillus sp.]
MTNVISERKPLQPLTFYIPMSLRRIEEFKDTSFNEIESFPKILIILEGNGLLSQNDKQHVVSRGSILLCDPSFGIEYHLKSCTPSPLQGILIGYRCLTTDGSKPLVLENGEPSKHSSKVIRLAREFENAWKNQSDRGPFYIQQLFIELLAEFHEELNEKQLLVSPWIEQVISYIDTHYKEDLTREQMASLAHVSPEHLSRAFRQGTGRTFNEYLSLIRIRASQKRLLHEMPKLDELAQEVGYKEGTYLSRKFKQVVGLSPTSYFNKHKRVVALNVNHTASLLALGITPELGVYSTWMESLKQVSPKQKLNVWENNEASIYENIAAVNPDLILDYKSTRENKALLSVAPVVELPFMDMSWREQFRIIADIVGRQQKAEAWIADYDEMIWNFNQKLDCQLGGRGTAIIWEIGTSSAYCINSSYGRGSQILYEDIGFSPPDSLLNHGIENRGYIEMEIEAIVDYPADYIFITGMPSSLEGKKRMSCLFQSSSWVGMEAAKQNQVYLIDKPDLFFGYDPLSSQAQVYELMRLLTS